MKRTLSKKEEQVYRLCHQDFGGFSTAEAAEKLGVSQRQIQQLLQNVERKAPQLFPVLTKQQAEIESLINYRGFTFEQVAEALGIPAHTISDTVEALKKKGVCFNCRKKTIQYQKYMDNQVIQKF